MSSPDPRLLAHRGSSGRWAEHTRAAFLQALEDGADGIECDLRLTSGGDVVCWHDPTLDRTSNGSGPVHASTLEQLRALDVSSWAGAVLPTRFGTAAEQLVTFAELLRIALDADRPLLLAVELKHPAPYGFMVEDAVLRVLADHGWDPATGAVGQVRVSLMAFHPGSLRHLLAAGVDPSVLMALLEAGGVRGVVRFVRATRSGPRRVRQALRLAAEARAMVDGGVVGGVGPGVAYVRAHPERVRAWVRAGRLVRVWTVDTAADLELCLSVGVNEITTNVPAALRELLDASRVGDGGGWHPVHPQRQQEQEARGDHEHDPHDSPVLRSGQRDGGGEGERGEEARGPSRRRVEAEHLALPPLRDHPRQE